MSLITATQAEKKAALHAAVMARRAYWDSMDVLEKMYVGTGDIEDKQSVDLRAHVIDLAANFPGTAANPNPDAIEDLHVAKMDAIFT